MTEGKFKILSFRSNNFKPDPGVVPDADICEKAGITVVKTDFQHDFMRDDGPDDAKTTIQGMLDQFLEKSDSGDSSSLTPASTTVPDLLVHEPGPVASNTNKPMTN
jgi:hypothetical protein